MRSKPLDQPLLDFLSNRIGCEYLSDLSYVDRALLRRELEQIPAEAASPQDWNDALGYLTRASPEATPQAARERLLKCLIL